MIRRALGALLCTALLAIPALAQQPPDQVPDPALIAMGQMLAEAQRREVMALIALEQQRRATQAAERRASAAEAPHAAEPVK